MLSHTYILRFFQVIRNTTTFVLRVKICSLSELDGYVVVVSTFTSRSGNEFFDVKLKVSESKTVTVRILKQANQTITEAYLKSLRQEGEPVKLKSLSKTQNGMFFLIPHVEVQLREPTQLILVLIINIFKMCHLLRHRKLAFLIF